MIYMNYLATSKSTYVAVEEVKISYCKDEQEKTVTPSEDMQEVVPDSIAKTLAKVIVEPIPGDYIKPEGDIILTERGRFDVRTKEFAVVEVVGGGDVTASSNFGALVDRSIISFSANDLEGITTIGDHSFRACTNLATVEIPEGVTSIGDYAFSGCNNLKSVQFEEDSLCSSIGDYAFSGCTKLNVLEFSDNLQKIGKYAFSNCTSLKEVDFKNVSYIDDYAFSGCINIDKEEPIDLSRVAYVGAYAFSGLTSDHTIIIASENIKYSWGSGWNGGANLLYADSGIQETEDDYYKFKLINNEAYVTAYKEPIGGTTKEPPLDVVTLKVTEEGEEKFYTYPIVELRGSIFYGHTEITKLVGKNIRAVYGNAFCRCSSLTDLVLPKVTIIDLLRTSSTGQWDRLESLFTDCPSLINVIMPELMSVQGQFLQAKYTTTMKHLDFRKLTTVILSNGNYVLNSFVQLEGNNKILNVPKITVSGNVSPVSSNYFGSLGGVVIANIPKEVIRFGIGWFGGGQYVGSSSYKGNIDRLNLVIEKTDSIVTCTDPNLLSDRNIRKKLDKGFVFVDPDLIPTYRTETNWNTFMVVTKVETQVETPDGTQVVTQEKIQSKIQAFLDFAEEPTEQDLHEALNALKNTHTFTVTQNDGTKKEYTLPIANYACVRVGKKGNCKYTIYKYDDTSFTWGVSGYRNIAGNFDWGEACDKIPDGTPEIYQDTADDILGRYKQ